MSSLTEQQPILEHCKHLAFVLTAQKHTQKERTSLMPSRQLGTACHETIIAIRQSILPIFCNVSRSNRKRASTLQTVMTANAPLNDQAT